MADTGCHSCMVGLELMKKFGLSSDDLIPVKMQMHSADNHNIPVLEAVILKINCFISLNSVKILCM